MNEAIKLAIEGGYDTTRYQLGGDVREVHPNGDGMKMITKAYAWRDYAIVTDPLFWQALGRALEWDDKEGLEEYMGKRRDVPGWEVYAKDYFHLVLTGGDTEKFWKELLK